MKTTVLKYLLLDADVIIYLHEIGLWKAFIKRFEVFVSAAVANEVRFYPINFGKHIPINLRNEKVKILEMNVQKANNAIYSTIDKFTGPDIQIGEIESIALMKEKRFENLIFCTGDRAAIIASCLLGLKERIISLEETMIQGGMKKKIKKHFTKDAMKKWKKKGETNLIQGVGLREKNK
ncbi:hypothetical protein KAW96_04855 [candidate division WOR-3 bacterium]|nr:hypothetical protein [candidate division WOR-3 bacterium]